MFIIPNGLNQGQFVNSMKTTMVRMIKSMENKYFFITSTYLFD